MYGGIAPSVLNFGSRWKWVFSFSRHLLCFCGKSPSKHWVGSIMGAWEKRSIAGAVLKRFAESQKPLLLDPTFWSLLKCKSF